MAQLGQVDLDEEAQKRSEQIYVPNWFSVELKTGVSPRTLRVIPHPLHTLTSPPVTLAHPPLPLLQMLTIRLEESDCYSTWVLAAKSGLPDVSSDLNCKKTLDTLVYCSCITL